MVISRMIIKLDGTTEQIFEKLNSRVTMVQTLIHPILNSTVATNRPWVGRFDVNNRRFEIIQTTKFFSSRIMEGNFFRLFINGFIEEDSEQANIKIEFKLGMRAVILFALIILFSLLVLINFFRAGTWVSLLVGLTPLMIMMILLMIQVGKTEKALSILFRKY